MRAILAALRRGKDKELFSLSNAKEVVLAPKDDFDWSINSIISDNKDVKSNFEFSYIPRSFNDLEHSRLLNFATHLS